jgi:excisionase family DNA binding protein
MNMHTIQEVADFFRVKPATVRRWIKAGKLDAVTLAPKTVRITEDAVKEFMAGGGR